MLYLYQRKTIITRLFLINAIISDKPNYWRDNGTQRKHGQFTIIHKKQ